MLLAGEQVARDFDEAAKWFLKAAESEDRAAYRNLGYMHFYGRGFAEDRPKGIEWYRKAAELGDAESQFMLGWCYRNGLALSTDKIKALMWMTLSMESFDESEPGLRDRAYKEQQVLMSEMNPEQIRLAVELAEEWEGEGVRFHLR